MQWWLTIFGHPLPCMCVSNWTTTHAMHIIAVKILCSSAHLKITTGWPKR